MQFSYRYSQQQLEMTNIVIPDMSFAIRRCIEDWEERHKGKGKLLISHYVPLKPTREFKQIVSAPGAITLDIQGSDYFNTCVYSMIGPEIKLSIPNHEQLPGAGIIEDYAALEFGEALGILQKHTLEKITYVALSNPFYGQEKPMPRYEFRLHNGHYFIVNFDRTFRFVDKEEFFKEQAARRAK